MRLNKRFIALLLTVFLVILPTEAKKRAFTVFIGDYPGAEVSGWSKIHAGNDKFIVLKTLYANGFQADEIVTLENSDATYMAITEALRSFVGSCMTGDNVYIHFSCHGQWITDIDGDEKHRNPQDRYDESIVPYDAQVAYNWMGQGYKGENHLIDDELNRYFIDIEKRIGQKGCLLVVVDACHSGGIQRLYVNEEDNNSFSLFRGSKDAFELPLKGGLVSSHSEDIDCLFITACHDFETNYECTINGVTYGRLSYAISKVWKSGMNQDSIRDAVEREFSNLAKLSPLPKSNLTQRPTFILPKRYSGRKLF